MYWFEPRKQELICSLSGTWAYGHMDRKKPLISRQAKGTGRVVLGMSKAYSAAEVARHSRLQT